MTTFRNALGCFARTAVLASAIVGFSASAMAADYVAKFGFAGTEDHPTSQGLERFAQLVSNRTNGAVEIQLFFGGQLGGEKEMAEQLRLNSLQGAMVIISVISNWVPEGRGLRPSVCVP